MITFDQLFRLLTSFEVKHWVRELIKFAEEKLEITIRGDYRNFLQTFGWGGVQHLELYGLGLDVPPYLDLIRVTESERVEMNRKFPKYLIPIMNDGSGNLYCIDTRFIEPSIIFWNHEIGGDQNPYRGISFSEWLYRVVKNL
ncbi:SMI1/KNR4 family protein [Leptospira interrogans serovar Valbuzzi str. Duyster]|uniref:SMI1/KNR4 family protein n=1 Tax=Leptospira interrogans TaxID=173 RepID=UPI0002BF3114|nr:SMI1/KNR4 family protein [Leptospira interrogans]EMJ56953.1 SMI1/KNR4 family protein [Leptospira interrogans serovar Valbuzzi str. Duyster]ENO70230.1 SMI1/KNR4 family protein [Leptospira interrogans serovar Valbuzzi str. Valbuzzi]